ncbi:polya polymerase [Lachnospiraceae bacterium 29-84]
MKLYNIDNVEDFLGVVDQCKGTVELVSKEGDRLNLKSQLTKFVTLTELFNNKALINEMELVAYDKEDIELLMKYMFGNQYAELGSL